MVSFLASDQAPILDARLTVRVTMKIGDDVTVQIAQRQENFLVSVVIAAFDAEATIHDCLESILAQTWTNLEILICDDASADNTCKIAESFGDERISVIRNSTNLGAGKSRDKALALCRGEWIALCDADDMWLPNRLEALIAATNGEKEVIAFDNIMICHSTSRGIVRWKPLRKKRAFKAHNAPVKVAVEQWLYSKSMFMKPFFSTSLLASSKAVHSGHAFGEDAFFWLKLIAGNGRLVYVPQSYYLYRITPGSATANLKRSYLMRQVLEECAMDFRDRPSIYIALLWVIRRTRRLELYRSFLDDVKQWRLKEALVALANHPWFAWNFIAHNVTITPYRIHRCLHGGMPRGTK